MSELGPTRLALGTVQFGLAYGVAGLGEPVPEPSVARILERAWQLGIDTIDTAPAYGSIEERIVRLIGDHGFRMVSKLPALPTEEHSDNAVQAALQSFDRTVSRLGTRLTGLMFHRADDLLSPHAQAVWGALAPLCAQRGIRLGVSCYDPGTLIDLSRRFDIRIAQLPGNALDQRVCSAMLPAQVEIHLRSVFLQGLLLMPLADAQRRVPAAAAALSRWHDWCLARGLTPLCAALSIVKSWPHAHRLVVGVDSLAQLEDIAKQWAAAQPLGAPELETLSAPAIDPRLWPLKEAA